jgi:hypothetical protein
MGYPPPPITHRKDGVTLFGRCGDGTDCSLVAQRLPNGSVRLAYHGTTKHSMILDFDQQIALADVLPILNHNGNNKDRNQGKIPRQQPE